MIVSCTMVKAVMGALLPPSVRDKIVLVRRHHQLVRCAVDGGSDGHAHDWTAAQVVRGMQMIDNLKFAVEPICHSDLAIGQSRNPRGCPEAWQQFVEYAHLPGLKDGHEGCTAPGARAAQLTHRIKV